MVVVYTISAFSIVSGPIPHLTNLIKSCQNYYTPSNRATSKSARQGTDEDERLVDGGGSGAPGLGNLAPPVRPPLIDQGVAHDCKRLLLLQRGGAPDLSRTSHPAHHTCGARWSNHSAIRHRWVIVVPAPCWTRLTRCMLRANAAISIGCMCISLSPRQVRSSSSF